MGERSDKQKSVCQNKTVSVQDTAAPVKSANSSCRYDIPLTDYESCFHHRVRCDALKQWQGGTDENFNGKLRDVCFTPE